MFGVLATLLDILDGDLLGENIERRHVWKTYVLLNKIRILDFCLNFKEPVGEKLKKKKKKKMKCIPCIQHAWWIYPLSNPENLGTIHLNVPLNQFSPRIIEEIMNILTMKIRLYWSVRLSCLFLNFTCSNFLILPVIIDIATQSCLSYSKLQELQISPFILSF